MTLDDITKALRASTATPNVALEAAVAHADALAPAIFALAEKFCRGIYLLPADADHLFYGLHVLAAARHPGLLDRLIAIARQPAEDIHRLLPEYITPGLTRLLLSVWDREPIELLRLIEHADLAPEVKWALYDLLARFAFDGRIGRGAAADFLARIERDNLIDDDDMTWWGWASAVVKLGLVELEPALRRVWAKPICDQFAASDQDEELADLAFAAQNPTDARLFDEDHVRTIDDPVEALDWIDHRAAAMAKWEAEHRREPREDDDVAATTRPTEAEQQWLSGFLVSRQAPPDTMSLEMIDGLLTALVIGPEAAMPSEYLPIMWGTDDGTGPSWDSVEQAEYFHQLMAKHWNAIAARRMANAPHRPVIEPYREWPVGAEWSEGFAAGVNLRWEAWQPLLAERRADEFVLPLLALSDNAPDDWNEDMTTDVRRQVVEHLPDTLKLIAAYWRDPARRWSRGEPARSAKIGRNEPCPCGSGKKYKKCCGSGGGPSTVH